MPPTNSLIFFCSFSLCLQSTVDKLIKKTNLALVVGSSSWREQFVSAVTVSAGESWLPEMSHPFIPLWPYLWKIEPAAKSGPPAAPQQHHCFLFRLLKPLKLQLGWFFFFFKFFFLSKSNLVDNERKSIQKHLLALKNLCSCVWLWTLFILPFQKPFTWLWGPF